MTKRRKEYVKARNIVRNNLAKQPYTIKLTAITAKYIVRAYHVYQKQCLVAREKRMQLMAEQNKTVPKIYQHFEEVAQLSN